MWDAEQYEKFRAERTRPFFDLLSRIPDQSYKSIVDLGCGTGDLTSALADHWPEARVTGVDSSEEMLAPARERAEPGRLEFQKGDAAAWRPETPAQLIVSNATFQWIPDHESLIGHVVSCLAAKGVLAVQVPANFESPSHALLEETIAEGPWAGKFAGRRRDARVLPLAKYVELGHSLGLRMDAWETVYHHVLVGRDAVLEWMKGTALRPVMSTLQGAELEDFLSRYSGKLQEAYPGSASGTVFPFRRLFFVARKP